MAANGLLADSGIWAGGNRKLPAGKAGEVWE